VADPPSVWPAVLIWRLAASGRIKHGLDRRDLGAPVRNMAAHGSMMVIYAALAGNAVIAATKFAAGWFTGSSACTAPGFSDTRQR
jgi:hypothetical protein